MKEKSIKKLTGFFLILSIVFVSLFVLVHPGDAAGNIYYVSPAGNDSNPGTQSSPWRTIQKAANTVTAGDTVYVQAGTYDERVAINKMGTTDAPILFQGQGTVEVDGFVLTGDYLQLKGFTVKVVSCAIAGAGSAYGINVTDTSSHFLIEENRVIQMVDGGIFTSPQTSSGAIRNNYFENNAQNAIEMHGQNHLVEGNEINGAIQQHPTCASANDDANGVWIFGSGHVLRNNNIHGLRYGSYVTNAHMDCFQTFGGWVSGDPARNTNILFEHNYCDALDYQSADENGSGFTIEDTSSSDNTFEHGIIIRNNLVFAAQCVGAQENTAWFSYVNNTCVTTPAIGNIANHNAMDLWPGTSYDNHHYWIQNNTYYNFNIPMYLNSQVWNTGTVTKGYNLAYNGGGAIVNDTGFTCGQNGDICADPLFAYVPSGVLGGDYHLQSNSPAIDAGAALTSVMDDYDGNSRPDNSGWDIGVYEYQSGPQAPYANFSASSTSGTVPLTVNFTDTSSGTPTSWSWSFGDGGTSTQQNPSYQYTTPGYYTVSLTAINSLGQDTETKTNFVVVKPDGTPGTIFSDNFETALNWTTSGNVNWYTGSPKNGTHSVQLLKVGSIEKTISTAGYQFVTVSFSMGANSLDSSSENVQALWYDGSTWITLKQISNGDPEENNSLTPFTYELPQTADNNSSLALRFKINASGTNDYGYVDDVTVAGFQIGSTPTNTPVPPTVTNTPVPPTATNTPVPPTPTSTPVSSSQRIFLDNFEAAFSGWSPSGTITWYTGSPKNGTHGIRMASNGAWMQKTISTVGYHDITVRVYMGAESFEASEAFKLFWWNGSSWVSLKVISNGSPEENGQLHYLEFALPGGANNTSTFKLAFNLQTSDSTDYGYIDDVEVWGLP